MCFIHLFIYLQLKRKVCGGKSHTTLLIPLTRNSIFFPQTHYPIFIVFCCANSSIGILYKNATYRLKEWLAEKNGSLYKCTIQLGNIQFLHCPALISHPPIDTIRLVTLIHVVSACKHVFLFQSCPCSMLLWRYQLLWSVKWQVIRPPVECVSNARLEKVSASPENGGKTRCKWTRMQMRECEILEDLISSYTLTSKALIGKILFTEKKKNHFTPWIQPHAAESSCRGHDGVDLRCLKVRLTPMNACERSHWRTQPLRHQTEPHCLAC